MMAGNQRKKRRGVCRSCGTEVAVSKADKLFRHLTILENETKIICPGTKRYPSHLVEAGELVPFLPPEIEVVKYVEVKSPDVFSETIDRVLPVYSLDGYVVGRAVVQVDRLVLVTDKRRLVRERG